MEFSKGHSILVLEDHLEPQPPQNLFRHSMHDQQAHMILLSRSLLLTQVGDVLL